MTVTDLETTDTGAIASCDITDNVPSTQGLARQTQAGKEGNKWGRAATSPGHTQRGQKAGQSVTEDAENAPQLRQHQATEPKGPHRTKDSKATAGRAQRNSWTVRDKGNAEELSDLTAPRWLSRKQTADTNEGWGRRGATGTPVCCSWGLDTAGR